MTHPHLARPLTAAAARPGRGAHPERPVASDVVDRDAAGGDGQVQATARTLHDCTRVAFFRSRLRQLLAAVEADPWDCSAGEDLAVFLMLEQEVTLAARRRLTDATATSGTYSRGPVSSSAGLCRRGVQR